MSSQSRIFDLTEIQSLSVGKMFALSPSPFHFKWFVYRFRYIPNVNIRSSDSIQHFEWQKEQQDKKREAKKEIFK